MSCAAAAGVRPTALRRSGWGGGAQDDALADVERRTTVRGALASLSLRDREIVLLKFHRLLNAELARALGISESNAGTRLHRALTRLRELCSQVDREEVA